MSDTTPLPWVVNVGEHAHITNGLYRGVIATIEYSPDRFLAVCEPNNRGVGPDEYLPNAELIVRAVNAHEPMLLALEGAEALLETIHGANTGNDDPWIVDLYATVQAALKLARGETL